MTHKKWDQQPLGNRVKNKKSSNHWNHCCYRHSLVTAVSQSHIVGL